MIITKLEPYNKKIKVYIDDSFAFVLYKGEISKLKIKEEIEIDDSFLTEIYELLFKRGKERALYLLDNSYKTEKYISDKLKDGLYPEIIITKIIEYLKEYDLINDKRYALLYIDYKIQSKSLKQIRQDLYLKGVSKELIDQAVEESNIDEEDTIKKIINKRKNKYNFGEKKDIQKIYNYLISKGFSYENIRHVVLQLQDTEFYE